MFIEVSGNLKKLSKFFPENLYVVGGYVRNRILHLEGSDVDICSSVDAQEVLSRLQGSEFSVKIKNIRLGALVITIGQESFEYTAFRKEVYPENDGTHCPSKVEFTDSLEDDAKRRDFTINAIYYNINKDECIDHFHGIVDTSAKIIRQINADVLKNDGERILRMVRIAGELGFKIDKQTFASAKKYVQNLKDIQGTRKYLEIEKILNCEKRYNLKNASYKKALSLLNKLGIWESFSLSNKNLKYKMVFKCKDRFLGLLIDIIDSEKPECLEVFVEKLLKEQFGITGNAYKNIFDYLSGYYSALDGVENKEYFFQHFENWAYIYPLLGCKSKHTQSKYNFFYQYIIEHNLTIKLDDLAIDETDIQTSFSEIDKRSFQRILKNLLSKVFDGKIKNEKQILLDEIKKNLIHF